MAVHENGTLSSASPVQQFYRRPLPQQCISFCSDEGKKIFMEALREGHMETYFVLASQFCTQEEPAFCGLTTLVMVLNALEVDPKKVWKSPWRWYHEQMLDCCVPMEVIEKSGITFDQFACLAICNTLEVKAHRVGAETSLDKFRELVAAKTSTSTDVVVISYLRGALGQTGEGHFSPIGGYHRARDLALILDVARFKYPPHWVRVDQLYEAMTFADATTGLARGYMLLTKTRSQPTVLFRFSARVSVTRPGQFVNTTMAQVIRSWQDYLGRALDDDVLADDELLASSVRSFIATLGSFGYVDILLRTQCEPTDDISQEHQRAVLDIVSALESLPIFSCVKQVISETDKKSDENEVDAACDTPSTHDCVSKHSQSAANAESKPRAGRVSLENQVTADGQLDANAEWNDSENGSSGSAVALVMTSATQTTVDLPRNAERNGPDKLSTSCSPACDDWLSCCTRAHYLTMLVLFWPYPERPGCRGARLQGLVDRQLVECRAAGCHLLQNEVHQLRQQLESILGYVDKCCHCSCANNPPAFVNPC